ncbi:ribonuclease H-like domain-containing protein [Tanacetum coccineum]
MATESSNQIIRHLSLGQLEALDTLVLARLRSPLSRSFLFPPPRAGGNRVPEAMVRDIDARSRIKTFPLLLEGFGLVLEGKKSIALIRSDGSLSRYKACLVATGRSQQHGIDYDETFSLVVKPATIHTILSLTVSRDWPIHQIDVKNAFLHGHLSETVYMHQPLGFVDPNKPNSRSTSGLFLSQSKFVEEILKRAHMQNYNPCRTPVDIESKLGSDGDPVCLYMHDPCDPHFTALKRILCYVCGTLDYGVQLHISSTTQLSAYTDADWAGCPVYPVGPTSGYCVFLGDNLLSWSVKRQVTLSRSSAEAKYRGVANVVTETAWIYNLLNANVQYSKLNANSELLCVKCNGCMLSDNHDLCVLYFINDVNARTKSKSVKKSSKRKVWKPTGKVFTNIGYTWRPTDRTFAIVGNECPLTRITTTVEVTLRKPTTLESDTLKPIVTLVYSRKPRKSKTNVPR